MITDIFERLFFFSGRGSRNDVKKRLKLVLAHDRSTLNASTLEKMRKEIMYLSIPNMIKKEEILYLIKNHNVVDSIKYNLANIIVYNIDIQNYEIKNYLDGCEKYNFINNLRNIDDYELKSTLNYLHDINNIYIIFNEEEKKEIKSIIKK